MKLINPLEFYLRDLAAFVFCLFFRAILFLIVALILLITKQKKAAKDLSSTASGFGKAIMSMDRDIKGD